MTTATVSTLVIRCPDPMSRKHGKEIGRLEVDASVTISITATTWCGTCRVNHRQTFRIS
jgi:hypothetical protein